MLFDIYIFVLSFIFVLLLYSFYLIRFSPNKIKIIGITVLAILFIRYICVLVMLLTHSMIYLYMLKMPYFLNLPGISIIALILFYIFIRRNYINFNYIFLISFAAVAIYIFGVYKFNAVVQGMDNFGYTMLFKENMTIYWTYIIFSTVVMFSSIMFSQKSNVNRTGLYMLALASFVTIAENIGIVINARLFPANIFGDLIFIITFIYALAKLKK